jgi:hypothetical protein
VRRGASWTAAYHLQLTVAAVARPIRGSVGAPGVLAVERSWLLLAQTAPAQRSVQPLSRGRALSPWSTRPAATPRRRSPLSSRRYPPSGLASGIQLSSRPVSGHLGSSSRGSGGRTAAVHPSGVQLCGCPSVRCPAVWCLPSSVRTRPSPPTQAVAVGTRSRWPATLTTGTGGGPGGCRAVDGSIDGRRGQDAGDAAEVAVVTGRSVTVLGRRVGCGPRRPPLPAKRPGRPRPALGAPLAGGCAVGTGAGSARWLHPLRGCRPRLGCVTTVSGRRRA